MKEMIWPEVPQWQRGCKEWINSRVVFPKDFVTKWMRQEMN